MKLKCCWVVTLLLSEVVGKQMCLKPIDVVKTNTRNQGIRGSDNILSHNSMRVKKRLDIVFSAIMITLLLGIGVIR